MSGKATKPRDFVDALSYPSKNVRKLGKDPISVPRDPLITQYTPFKGKKTTPKNFFYSIFFTAFDVRDYGPEIKKFMKIFAPLSVKKVYLESYRDGYSVPSELLKKTAAALKKERIKVSGAVTTTHFSDTVKYNEEISPASCYSGREGKRNMKKVFESAAPLFSEIIIDDWYFTVCRCPACTAAKGKKTWGEFRSKLLFEAAKKHIIAPAKKANKNIKLILKLPQWYENYYNNGYDIEKLIPLFDEICVGTETRDFNKMNFMPPHAALLFRYIKDFAPEKVKKAWFDIYMCDEKIYTEQAYQSVLGGAKELILFCAGIMPQKEMRPLVSGLIENTPKIDRLSGFSSIFSIPVIHEANSGQSDLIHQYLLMAGIPVYLTGRKTAGENIVILTESSCAKSERLKLFNGFIKAEKDLVMTAGFAGGLSRYFNIRKLKKEAVITGITYSGKESELRDDVYLDRDINNGKNIALLNRAYSLISFFKIKNSRIWIINLPYSKAFVLSHIGTKQSAKYRYILRSPAIIAALKHVFEGYANLNLYESMKTFYKYDI